MNPNTHYAPTETGFSISGSNEIFNRMLYGSHTGDDRPERFFTFAGDAPQFMGAICDWTKGHVANQEKCGVLSSGLAITPGRRAKFYYSKDIDQTSRWFHNSEDILAEFKHGWMEYELSQISSWFPDVRVNMEVYPLLPEDGYLVHYHITTDQRVHFVAGFGGLTSALTTEAECFYFSDVNHATVQRIPLDPTRELAGIKIEAIANEVILGVAGISISR